MRQTSESFFQFTFLEPEKTLPKTVREFRKEYRKIDAILRETPQILELVQTDLRVLSCSTGKRDRRACFSVESILRSLIVKQKEGLTYREACIRITESEFLKDFCFLIHKNSIDHTFLCKAFKEISPETWGYLNFKLANSSRKHSLISVDCIRTDSTVIEGNRHWPTDSSLLWDTYRTVERLIKKIREENIFCAPYRFHPKKIKTLHLFVTRHASSNSKKRKRQVKRKMKKLIAKVETAVLKASRTINMLNSSNVVNSSLFKLRSYLPSMQKVVSVAARRWINEEKVPLKDKVFSIFEPHIELIQRGRAEKPIEFGHKIVLSQSREKFITGYEVLERKIEDCELLESVIEQHEQQYGKKPKALAADMGFCPDVDSLSELNEEIELLEIPRRSRDYSDPILCSAQRFRAGIEGTISCLKRSFRLSKCYFRGFKNFESAIGSAIFCHNLTVLAKAAEV